MAINNPGPVIGQLPSLMEGDEQVLLKIDTPLDGRVRGGWGVGCGAVWGLCSGEKSCLRAEGLSQDTKDRHGSKGSCCQKAPNHFLHLKMQLF